jgi:hypothetical protein
MRICYLTPLDRRGPWATPEYGSGSWPLALGAEFFPYGAEDLAPLEACGLFLLHTSAACYEAALRVLDRFPHTPAVLLLTCDAMFIDPQGFFADWTTPLKALLDRARLAISETQEVGFFQAMTPTPVVHLPLPVPVAAIRQAGTADLGFPIADCRFPIGEPRLARFSSQSAIGNRKSEIGNAPLLPLPRGEGWGEGQIGNRQSEIGNPPLLLLGSPFRPRKNGLATALAFRQLRKGDRYVLPGQNVPVPFSPFSPEAIVFAEEPEAEREAYRLWGVQGVEVRPACSQPDYWGEAARCDLALHLDYRRTIGRFSAECAALGIPCISTAGATMQRALFPELVVEPWDVDGAAALAARLLRDPILRDRVVASAARAVEAYGLAPMARRFHEVLERFTGISLRDP